MSKNLYLIDGSALAYRSYYAFSQANLRNSKGDPTGAVYGFTKALLKLIEEEEPDLLAVVWDAKGKTFRHEQYEEYKAHRKPMPDDLKEQIEPIKEVVKAFDIPYLEKKGFEADDIIGTLAKEAEEDGYTCYIVSGDKDFAQLVSDHIYLYSFDRQGNKKIYDTEKVEEKYGVTPAKMRDFLALVGDKSDNVPGVPGIGKKTAKKLLNKWGSLDEILDNLDNLGSKRAIRGFEENVDQARLSQELVTIHTEMSIDVEEEDLQWEGPDEEKVKEVFTRLEFTSLLKSMGIKAKKPKREKKKRKINFETIGDLKDLEKLKKDLIKEETFAFRHLITGPDAWEGRIIATAFSRGEESHFVEWSPLMEKGEEKFLKIMNEIFSSSATKRGYDLKRELLFAREADLEVSGPYSDVMIAGYLLDPTGTTSEPELKDLANMYLPEWDFTPAKHKVQRNLWEEEEEAQDLGREVAVICDLAEILEEKLAGDEEMEKLYWDVEMPLVEVLARMERRGIKIDVTVLQDIAEEVRKLLEGLEEEIHEMAGEEFNINSPQQLGKILFEKLEVHKEVGVKKIKKTKTGYSTAQSVLEELTEHPMPDKILEYRSLSKLLNTYLEPLQKQVNPFTQKIHPTFHQARTATGRLSCSDPNLQNIPIRTARGEKIRAAFVPSSETFQILSADYSQIELRLLAHFSEDEDLLQAFTEGRDIHTITAARIMGLELEEVTSKIRSQAKAVNYGILYGMGPHRLSREQDISYSEAKEFIENYFEKYPQVKNFLDSTVEEAKKTEKVSTILGRHRLLPNINSGHHRARAEAERMAVNTPIQGSASDIIKLAMVRLERIFEEREYESKMVLQIHDELLFEVADSEREEVKELVRKEMEGAVDLKVPLKVDMGVAENWLKAH